MTSIWKFPLSLTEVYFKIQMPRGSKVLTVQAQTVGLVTKPYVWAEVPFVHDPNYETVYEERRFAWAVTGGDVPRKYPCDYRGTVQFSGLVLHLYEFVRFDETWPEMTYFD